MPRHAGIRRNAAKYLILAIVFGIGAASAQPRGAKLPEGARRLEPTQLALTVGADGRPDDIRCVSENARRLCALLTRAVSGWRFEPGRRNEVAEAMAVFLDLTLVAVPEQAGFAVKAEDSELSLRGSTEESIPPMSPPAYPQDAMRRGITGSVELELLIEPGRPTYRVGRIWFNGKPVENRRNDLVWAAVKAAESTPVRSPPPELLSGCVQVNFILEPGPSPRRREKACKDAHVPGFTPPKLLTDVTQARF